MNRLEIVHQIVRIADFPGDVYSKYYTKCTAHENYRSCGNKQVKRYLLKGYRGEEIGVWCIQHDRAKDYQIIKELTDEECLEITAKNDKIILECELNNCLRKCLGKGVELTRIEQILNEIVIKDLI
jgi:hypothetical protein